ncbi:anaphase-promoting complex subunit 8 [Verticillium dahliae VdLs.17]|uniref:Anaphase-promoting complex subunit 8 n=1 Tax=Verticillium dahliae (strain VdLs.17 / ATCC MYA-4575 / FGSC 10137) TaxID=498257 RepID=G2XEE4_VERDV|nr:anaphase-promoting complex subunit 8 [Verticillium dahliae VdLs.17]EGY18195.1 anaphase-promoting complex subunit 8 [Verticillium dahliae VdLs.17]
MSLNAHDLAQLRAALQDAVVKCSERCLYQSAKWAAELLDAIPDPSHEAQPDESTLPSVPVVLTANPDPDEALLEAKEVNKYLLAKSFFDCREFDRCAAVFLPDSMLPGIIDPKRESVGGTPSGKGKSRALHDDAPATVEGGALPNLSQKSLFLALYAKVMSGEKRKNEDSEMVMGPQDLGTVVNKQLLPVGRFLSRWFEQRTAEDGDILGSQGWLEYLYGMVLAKEKNEDKAMEYFIRSVHLFPMNWGCWLEMTSLITRLEDQGPSLANSLDQLLGIFPTSAFLLTCNALLAYHAKDLAAAEQHFSRLLSLHPYRLDSLDHYSNILYVMELRPKLAFIAHLCSNIDRFRPESCVVVGNYYSLLSMHEKAVQYFRRALTLDRTCLSAWTLMGHEYVELKNTHAAIESYRRAVDVNRRDYRAWYGLGQTYEVLEMHTYSLWYYKKAAGLRPWDAKMWVAVGSCLQRMGREREGIKALKRALLADAYYDVGSSFGSGDILSGRGATGHMDPDVLFQIAFMYNEMGDMDEAKSYMELCVAQEDGGAGDTALAESIAIHNDSPGASDDEDGQDRESAAREGTGVTAATSRARMWLARYAMDTNDYEAADKLATELTQDGYEVEEAKALVREARSRLVGYEEQVLSP